MDFEAGVTYENRTLEIRKGNVIRIKGTLYKVLVMDHVTPGKGRAHVQTPRGPVDAEITWIAWAGNIYRLATGRPAGRLRGAEAISRAISRTFRPLTVDERAELTELRVRIVTAREEESLESLTLRTGNEWDLHRTASVNGLVVGTPLSEGRPMKIALRKPYRAPPAPAGEPQ